MEEALNREAQAWVVRLASGQATEADGEAFKLWCKQSAAHAQAFVRTRAIWQGMGPAGQRLKESAASADATDGRQLPPFLAAELQRRRVPLGRRAFIGAAFAVSAAYLVARPPLRLWPGIADYTADLRTGTGEQRRVVVADQVAVELNTQTRIDLRKEGGAVTGLELLEGEAEISAGAPGPTGFVVVAGSARLLARGARFNVRYTGPEACVTCLEGRVELVHADRRETIVAERQVTYDARRVSPPRAADVGAVTAWRQRMLVFTDVPLADMIDEINRYRTGRIILTSAQLGANRVNANFSVDRLGDVGALIRDTYGADVTELPAGIMLVSQRRT